MQLVFHGQGAAISYFRISETEAGSRLLWGFDTDLVEGQGWFAGLLARYFGLFSDRWIGDDYEAGLARIKELVESMPPADFSDLEVEIVEVEPLDILFLRNAAADSSNDLGSDLAADYREISAFMNENAIEMAAQPIAITRIRPTGGFTVEAAIPVVLPDVLPNGHVVAGRSPAGRALRVVHRGPYDRMAPTYAKLAAWMAAHGLSEGHVSWEQYVSDPRETPPEALITHIYFMLDDEP
jgi:effector-binding domain-containing protein